MFDDTFLIKKALLERRDTLLEEIGQTVLAAGDLPPEFARLPQEFNRIDILLNQLKDRYRCLAEERDRVNLDYEDLQRLLNEKNLEFGKRMKPCQHDWDELRLKLDYLQDQMRSRGARLAQTAAEQQKWASCFREADGKRAAILAEWEACRHHYQEEMAPLSARIHKLQLAIRKNREEAENLSSERGKRLRDLGYWHSSGNGPTQAYQEKWEELEKVRRELAQIKRTVTATKPVVVGKKENRHWGWLVTSTLVAAMIGYNLRTEFREEEVTLAGYVSGFMPDHSGYRLFADLSRVGQSPIAAEIPSLATLPDGESVFHGRGAGDLYSCLIARQDDIDGPLLFCGLKFRLPFNQFSSRLTQLGWKYETTLHTYKALTDGKWIWLILNNRTFFLLPVDRLAEFEALKNIPGDEMLRLVERIAPYDNNQALLQGFDTLAYTLKRDNSFRLAMWSREQPPADMSLRARYVEALNPPNAKIRISFSSNRLIFTGDQGDLRPAFLNGRELRAAVLALTDNLLGQARTALTFDDGPPAQIGARAADLPEFQDQKVRVFDLRNEGFSRVEERTIGIGISDLDWQSKERRLLVTDAGGGLLLRYRFSKRKLVYDHHLVFAETTATQPEMNGFLPAATFLAPDGLVAVVLEAHGENKRGQPRVALIDLQKLTVLSVEELPRDVRACLSAGWDDRSDSLYVGCAARKRRGKMGPAVLVYRREGTVLSLKQLIELPYKRGELSIPSLVPHPQDPLLLLYQLPDEMLTRYTIGEDVAVSLNFGIGPEEANARLFAPTSSLLLNRTADRALLLSPGQSAGIPRHFLTLTDLRGDTPVSLDVLDLEAVHEDAVRLPFSDQLCIASSGSGSLTFVRIDQDRLVLVKNQPLQQFIPGHLTTDHWGHFLFVAGRPSPGAP